jgi:hypothetical protein
LKMSNLLGDNSVALMHLEERLIAEYQKALIAIGDAGVKIVQKNFDNAGAVATGEAKRSIQRTDIQRIGSVMRMSIIPTGDRARIMRFIENGRKPGKMPPLDDIIEWMEAKGISQGMTPGEERNVAFAIARNVADFGLKGHKIFAKSRQEIQPIADRIIQEATKRALSSLPRNK